PYANDIGKNGIDRRVDHGGLNLSTVPKAFHDTGHIRNPTEAGKLKDPAFRQRPAGALAEGLRDNLNLHLPGTASSQARRLAGGHGCVPARRRIGTATGSRAGIHRASAESSYRGARPGIIEPWKTCCPDPGWPSAPRERSASAQAPRSAAPP